MTTTETTPKTYRDELMERAVALTDSDFWRLIFDPACSVITTFVNTGEFNRGTATLIEKAEEIIGNFTTVQTDAVMLTAHPNWTNVEPLFPVQNTNRLLVERAAAGKIGRSDIRDARLAIEKLKRVLERPVTDKNDFLLARMGLAMAPPKVGGKKNNKKFKAHSTMGPPKGRTDEIPLNPNAGKERKK